MRKYIENVFLGIVAVALAVVISYPLWADYTIPQPGSSLTGLAFTCGGKVCPAQTLVSSGGTEYNSSAPLPIAEYRGTTALVADPCQSVAKTWVSQSTSSSGQQIIAAASAKKTYICSIAIVTSAAANVSIIEGTGSSVCTGGVPAGVYLNSGTTAANGAAFAANGGIAQGNGSFTVVGSTTNNQNICTLFTTANSPNVVTTIGYVQQ